MNFLLRVGFAAGIVGFGQLWQIFKGQILMSKSYTVKVIDKLEGQTILECPVEEQDKAFEYAKQMEELGLDVKIDSPSVPESLARVLGAREQEIQNLRHEIDKEIDSHSPDTCQDPKEQNAQSGEAVSSTLH